MFRPLVILMLLGAYVGIAARMAHAAEVAAIFGSHMVLQRDMPLRMWGDGTPGERVEVQLKGQRVAAIADGQGRWAVTLSPLPAGGPHTMSVHAASGRVELHDILVGEVWLASGQSNMDWPVQQSSDAANEIAAADHPTIRHFKGDRVYADEPAYRVRGTWEVCTPQSVGDFSGVAYAFGRELSRRLGVPIGVVQAAWGGSAIEAWMAQDLLESLPEGRERLKDLPYLRASFPRALENLRRQEAELAALTQEAEAKGLPAPSRVVPAYEVRQKEWPCGLYNGMIHPLVGFPIRGVIWYQGEANATRARDYAVLFPAMIVDWRRRWGQGDYPFLYVQIANYRDRGSQPRDNDWARLREAQTQALKLSNTGMAVAIDVGEATNIHPSNKREVGRRLSLLAADLVYGQDVQSQSPRVKSVEFVDGKAVVTFERTYGELAARGDRVRGFALAGADRRFDWADAEIDGDRVVLTCPSVAEPVAVRYGWDWNPDVNLYNAAGLPATPFRTDGW